VQSGSAQAGIVALSLASSPAMKSGKSWMIPADMHPAIEQAAIVLNSARDKSGSLAFLKFVKSPSGRKILERFGFRAPDNDSGQR
jgi:molybdate transport system substrate-binding protein